MNFICDKVQLQNAVNTVLRAVPSKSTIQTLEGLYFECTDQISITGYDLKRAIHTSLEADITERGLMLVNARFFAELLRRLPDGMITLTYNDYNSAVNVKCGRSEFNFQAMEIEDYPEVPNFDEVSSVEIPQNILSEMIRRSIFAVSKDEIRPVYTGALFEIEDNELTLVAVDGYRLARRVEKIENGKLENGSFIVPGFALSDIEKICDDTDDPIRISVGNKHISFTIGETVVITRRLEGDFLNHRKSVPENFRYTVKIERQEMMSVIDRVSLVLSDKNSSPVRMMFEDGTIHCICATPIGKAEDTCSCEGSGEGLEIGFNDRYLLDALKACEDDELLICLNTSSSPCIIRAADGSSNYTYMILPVRISAR